MRLAAAQIGRLIDGLRRRGYQVTGPTLRDGAIVYDEISGIEDLPRGWSDEQEAGRYRLERRADQALFAYAVGPQSWKKFLHPAQVKLFAAEQKDGVFRILDTAQEPARRFAFLGVRACELAAIAVQDRVLTGGPFRDSIYGGRRDGAFLVAVQCTHSAATCFCASMGTGPEVRSGADITLTEVVENGESWFLADAESGRGRELLAELDGQPSNENDRAAAGEAVSAAARNQKRKMDTAGIRELLYDNFEHPRWDNVAERCLACANCTMVCPTCFCTTIEDVSDVSGEHAERWRQWDSCFTMNFSYIHGGSVRASGKARYRQWMTHKLASWIDQFGSSGCVGCGRCIAWCPVGIDITEEVEAIRHGKTES